MIDMLQLSTHQFLFNKKRLIKMFAVLATPSKKVFLKTGLRLLICCVAICITIRYFADDRCVPVERKNTKLVQRAGYLVGKNV